MLSPRKSRPYRAAFTLVEIMVTTLVMLIMVLAISQMFSLVGRHVTDGRAVIELQGQLRNAGFRIQEDLNGLTVVARQSPDYELHLGYFEYIEGADDPGNANDGIGSDVVTRFGVFTPPADGTHTAYGDIDDAVMFTARSTGQPFIGTIRRSILTGNSADNLLTSTIESHDAEILYWTDWDDSDGNGEVNLGEVLLRRRVLLIRPDLPVVNMPIATTITPDDLRAFYNQSDLSVHLEIVEIPAGSGTRYVRITPNSLADLALRDNRTAHFPNQNVVAANFPANPVNEPRPFKTLFPNFFSRSGLPRHFNDMSSGISSVIGPTGARLGDDVVVADVLAFDVRAYDPTAQVRQMDVNGSPGGDLLRPGDINWDTAAYTVGNGAFVDLYYFSNYLPTPGASLSSWFSGTPSARSGLGGAGGSVVVPTYDTWTWAYEQDGVDQDGDGVTDEATDGIDNDGVRGVDDPGERETNPPYARPLRGIQITLRVIELNTRQVRQSTVVSRLMPE
jgi:hypothetical protein